MPGMGILKDTIPCPGPASPSKVDKKWARQKVAGE